MGPMKVGKHRGTQGIITFPDFTGFLQKNETVRDEVMGQLRQIWDGFLLKVVGNQKDALEWHGKVSCIAAVTPAIERFHKLNGELGERFISVRWPNQDQTIVAQYALRQTANETDINRTFGSLVKAFVDTERIQHKDISIDATLYPSLIASAVLLAKLRSPIEREKYGQHNITNVPESEAPTRIVKALGMVMKSNACNARREEDNEVI